MTRSARHHKSIAALVAASSVGLLLAAEVARLIVADRLAPTNPQLAMRLAPHSPSALVSMAMAQVGQAAARGESPSNLTLQRLRGVTVVAPLRPEPFLVQAALAERAGQLTRAESLLLQARWRDPRSTAAAYLLADVRIREGKILDSLGELAVLARLLPGTSVQLIPALSQYAHSPGAGEKLRTILQDNPGLKRPLLNALAADPQNIDLALDLAGADLGSADAAAKAWKARLLKSLVERGDYKRAYGIWRRFAGLPAGESPILFNGAFRDSPAPPPFNWSFASGSAGVAEPSGGKLRVLYYGRNDLRLAFQLLLLQPGRYRFLSPAAGQVPDDALAWTLTCVSSGKQIMRLEIGKESSGAFDIPAGCQAQRLVLNGESEEMPRISDLQIGPVILQRQGA